jgi:hypothetical protein
MIEVVKKILFILALLLCPLSGLGQTGAIQGTSTLGGISATTQGAQSSNKLLGVIPAAKISIYLTGTQTLATLTSDGTHSLSNPFYSNASNAVNPGGYIAFASTNIGYDVVASSGQGTPNCTTGPLCYTQPVTLCKDCFASSQFQPGTIVGPWSVTTPGIFTNIVSHCANEGFVHGANLTMFASSGYSNFTQDGVCGAVINPVGSTNSQSNGVSGMTDNFANGATVTNSPAAMGGYFQVRQYGNGSGSGFSNTAAWGINAVGIIEDGVDQTTLSNEVDFDVNSAVTNATVYGWQINFPYFDSLPISSLGVSVGTPGCRTPNTGTYPATGCPQLQYGYVTQAGSTPVSYLSSPLYSTARSLVLGGSPSQSMQFLSLSSANSPKSSYISSDVQGNLDLIPYTGQNVSVPALGATSINSSGPISAATALNGNGGIINETDGTTGLISLRTASTNNFIESANPASTTDVPLTISGHNGTGAIPALTIIATTTTFDGSITVGGSGPSTIGLTPGTYAALNAAYPCASNAGRIAAVSDSNSVVWGGVESGGSAGTYALVSCNGVSYTVIGK